jgi:hypothetical protein
VPPSSRNLEFLLVLLALFVNLSDTGIFLVVVKTLKIVLALGATDLEGFILALLLEYSMISNLLEDYLVAASQTEVGPRIFLTMQSLYSAKKG